MLVLREREKMWAETRRIDGAYTQKIRVQKVPTDKTKGSTWGEERGAKT